MIDFENDIIIDESALDVEWVNQPALAMKYSKYWADCAKKLQQAEEAVKLTRAKLIKNVTEKWEKLGYEKEAEEQVDHGLDQVASPWRNHREEGGHTGMFVQPYGQTGTAECHEDKHIPAQLLEPVKGGDAGGPQEDFKDYQNPQAQRNIGQGDLFGMI